jgi:hypothetical protein
MTYSYGRYYGGRRVNTDYQAHVANDNDSYGNAWNKRWDSYKRQHTNAIFDVGHWRVIIIANDECWVIFVTV